MLAWPGHRVGRMDEPGHQTSCRKDPSSFRDRCCTCSTDCLGRSNCPFPLGPALLFDLIHTSYMYGRLTAGETGATPCYVEPRLLNLSWFCRAAVGLDVPLHAVLSKLPCCLVVMQTRYCLLATPQQCACCTWAQWKVAPRKCAGPLPSLPQTSLPLLVVRS